MKNSDEQLPKSGILCWAEPFGFGPSAALNLFGPYLPGPRDFAGTPFTNDLQSKTTFRNIIHCDTLHTASGALCFSELCRHYPTTFIVSDFKAAELSYEAGCKTILYDPIAWFWRGQLPEICHHVDAYICQDFFGVRERLEKEKVKNASIVSPLFPLAPISLTHCQPEHREGVLINLGGLQNPFMDIGACCHYAQLILDQVALSTKGYEAFSSRSVVEGVSGHPFSTQSPDHLRKKLATCRLAFMTPGLGNIYDASVLGNLVCFLPPTNDSQGRQLYHLRRENLAPFSIDWHEILEGVEPINYDGEDQEAISKNVSFCLHRLLDDIEAQRRLKARIDAVIDEASGSCQEPPLKRLVELFGSSKRAEEQVGSIAHQVVSQEKVPSKQKPAPAEATYFARAPLHIPPCNENIDDPLEVLQKLHSELNGTGFHTLSYLLDFIRQVHDKDALAPTKEMWQQAVSEFSPDQQALFASYGASYCVPLAEQLVKRAQDSLGIKGQIVYVEYQNSKRPLHRVWPDYRGPVHADAVFQYRRRGSSSIETIHIICGLGSDPSKCKYFSDTDSHHRFLLDENYTVDSSKVPLQAIDRSIFYKDVLSRWDLVEIVKGPKVNRHSTRFSVDMIAGVMTFQDKTVVLDALLREGKEHEDALNVLKRVQNEFCQPEGFIDSMTQLAALRCGFVEHVLGRSSTHLEHALRNLTQYGLGWVENFGLNNPTPALEKALEHYLGNLSAPRVLQYVRYLSKACSIWLGMQTKVPAQRDLEILLLQAAILLDHHVVIHRERMLEERISCTELPTTRALKDLAQASELFSSPCMVDEFVEHTEQILLDHLLLGFFEAGTVSEVSQEEVKQFEERFTALVESREGLSSKSKELLFSLLGKIVERDSASKGKLQAFVNEAIATDQINAVESYYWDNIPIRALLRELPQATRAFSVAAQVGIFEDEKLLKSILYRHRPLSCNKDSAAVILDSLFNKELITLVQRYAGVGLGPQLIALSLDAAKRCAMVGRFQAETLVGFTQSSSCKLDELKVSLELAERVADHPILRAAIAKHWGLPLELDKEGLFSYLQPELINNFFHSRFLRQFLHCDEDKFLDILAQVITSDVMLRANPKHPTLQRMVDRAFLETGRTPEVRPALQELACHPFGPQLMKKIVCQEPLDTLVSDIEKMMILADRLWDEELRNTLGGRLTETMMTRFSDLRVDWVEHELPYYEPNCAISVVPQKAVLTQNEEKSVAFFERVRIFWQDPFAICRVVQKLLALLEIERQKYGVVPLVALTRLLVQAERAMGFSDVVCLDKGFSPKDFYAVLRGGHPFNDIIFLSQPHGSRAHRLQWLLLYIEFGTQEQELASFYQELGNEELIAKLGYPLSSTLEDIWRLLFDNLHQHNFSCADHVMRVLTKQLGFNPDEVHYDP